MQKTILIQAWNIYKNNSNYYIEYTQAVYINTLLESGLNVHLICTTHEIKENEINRYSKVSDSVTIYELPAYISYIGAYRYFPKFVRLYQKLKHKDFDIVYSRFPAPFGWLQMLFFSKNRIVHFVGDPIDTVLKNNDLNPIFKFIKISLFLPEYSLFLLSSYRATNVYTNGHHIASKLQKLGIKASPLVSSTLVNDDFFEKKGSLHNKSVIKLIYVGYLRKAKGMFVLMDALEILNELYTGKFTLTIVGTGEIEKPLKKLAKNKGLPVNFLGHIDNRLELNKILREHDIFCFASISEGSPRVILEAVANGLLVVSTPVGSLPYIFENEEDILYFDFDDSAALSERVIKLTENPDLTNKLRRNSFEKVKNLKISNFIQKAFNISQFNEKN